MLNHNSILESEEAFVVREKASPRAEAIKKVLAHPENKTSEDTLKKTWTLPRLEKWLSNNDGKISKAYSAKIKKYEASLPKLYQANNRLLDAKGKTEKLLKDLQRDGEAFREYAKLGSFSPNFDVDDLLA